MIPLVWASLVQAAVVPAPPPGAAVEAAYKPRRIAVLIGVQEYDDPSLQGLKFATKDAVDLGHALQEPSIGGFDRVFVIAGRAATSRTAIQNALDVATADLQRDDTFLVYMSGHGTLTIDSSHGSRLWFLPSDGKLDDPEHTGISVANLESRIHDLTARRRVLILDTCHNGRSGSKSLVTGPTQQLLSGFRGEPPAPRDVREISESEARLYAAQYWQPAMEDPELQNGVYTHYLLEALEAGKSNADLNRDGLVDVAEAHEYARDRTIARTAGIQVPRAEYRIVGREEIYLSGAQSTRTAAEKALVTACDLLLSKAKLIVNGIPRGELPGVYGLEPGSNLIEVQDPNGSTLIKRRIHVEAGTTLSLEDLMDPSTPTLGVLGGASYLGGSEAFAPWNGSVELLWSRPLGGQGWFRPDVHLGADLGRGWFTDGGQWVSVDDRDYYLTGGEGTTGAGWLGLTGAWSSGPVYVGPFADARVALRSSDTDLAGETAVRFGAAGGLAVGVTVPMSAHLRFEGRAEGYGALQPDLESDLAPLWGASLRMGISTTY